MTDNTVTVPVQRLAHGADLPLPEWEGQAICYVYE